MAMLVLGLQCFFSCIGCRAALAQFGWVSVLEQRPPDAVMLVAMVIMMMAMFFLLSFLPYCCLSSSLVPNKSLVALCKPSGFVVPFVSQLCFLFSFLKSLQDLLFELKPLDENGDDNGDDDGAAFFY